VVVVHDEIFVLECANTKTEVKLAVAHLIVKYVIRFEVFVDCVVQNLDVL